MTVPRVAVVGGGITGLTAAFTLQEDARRRGRPLEVRVFESGAQAGGHAQTVDASGFLVERGPNAFLTRERHTLDLVEALGLTSRLVYAAPESARRYLLRGGRLCAVPAGPASLVTSPALSWRAKLRLLGEPFAAPASPGADETVHAFATRRLGRETADMLVDAAVAGISAGDSRRLSVAAEFPRLVEMERTHGSLVRAMFAPRPRPQPPAARAPRARLASFDRGLGVLPAALVAALGDRVRCDAGVQGLRLTAGGWRLGLVDGQIVDVDAVVLATAAPPAAAIVRDLDGALARALDAIEYAGLSVVALGYRATDLRRGLDGYGYLTARSEALATLGVVWESSLFPGRAPVGHVLLRAMLGGSRHPDTVAAGEDAIAALAQTELAPVVGVTAAPVHVSVQRWPAAIAQYTVGHGHRRAAIQTLVDRHPGLFAGGTAYDGVAFNDAVRSGRLLAGAVAGHLWPDAGDVPAPRRRVGEVPA
jgi:oxygen-dependent protoporphyrinogen oxidase